MSAENKKKKNHFKLGMSKEMHMHISTMTGYTHGKSGLTSKSTGTATMNDGNMLVPHVRKLTAI